MPLRTFRLFFFLSPLVVSGTQFRFKGIRELAVTLSTFSKGAFNAAAYAAARPHYPKRLYKHVVDYASSLTQPPRTVIDLGCGPGLSTFELVPYFERVIGLDPGQGMVNTARGIAEERKREWEGKEVRFEVGKGEDLSLLDNATVDLAVAGQAAHWFDHSKVYAELRRVLKPGGAFAYWGYGEMFFPRYPKLTKLVPKYSAGTLGPYWQQPGRAIVENLLRDVPFPTNAASPSETDTQIHTSGQWDPSTFQRTYFVNRGGTPRKPTPHIDYIEKFDKLLLVHKWDLNEIEAYLRTWSAAFSYNEKHPGEDVVAQMVKRLREGFQKEFINIKRGEKIDVAWEMVVVAGKKKK